MSGDQLDLTITGTSRQEHQIVSDLGDVRWVPAFLEARDAHRYFMQLKDQVDWQKKKVKLFGKEFWQPRLMAWYGDKDATYTYSGLRNEPLPWIKPLNELKQQVERYAQSKFNSVLCNFYRDGADSMGFHRDLEGELGHNPTIASLSFGQARGFVLKCEATNETKKVRLAAGDLLLMRGETQKHWLHGLPKSKKDQGERINLTFRNVLHAVK